MVSLPFTTSQSAEGGDRHLLSLHCPQGVGLIVPDGEGSSRNTGTRERLFTKVDQMDGSGHWYPVRSIEMRALIGFGDIALGVLEVFLPAFWDKIVMVNDAGTIPSGSYHKKSFSFCQRGCPGIFRQECNCSIDLFI